jgi:ABC-type multidrug transport system fused ATPase/permease subunit
MFEFVRFFRRHLRDPGLLVWSMVFAFINAGALGAGLLGMLPVFRLIFDPENEDRGLVAWAERHNADSPRYEVPQWVVERLPEGRFDGVLVLVLCLAALTIFGATCNFLHQYFSITLAARSIARIRLTAFDHVLRMPLGQVSLSGPSQFIARIIRDSAELQRGIIAMTSKAVATVLRGIVAFMVALFAGGQITIAALVVVPIMAFVLRKMGKRIRRGTKGALRGQEELLRLATESVHGLRAVKANTGEQATLRRFAEMNEQVVRQELRARLARALSSPLLELIAIIALGGLAVYAAKEIVDGRLTVDRFMLAIGALAVAGSCLKPLASLVNELQAAAAPARRLDEILAFPSEEPEGTDRPDLPPHHTSVEFDHVTLRYPGQTAPALDDVTFRIEHGQRVAIVGPNGSGKTTLLSLVPRLLTPDTGRVLVDGEDLRQFNLRSIRTQVGVVTQETVLFRGTIEDNITYGLASADHEQIVEAARHARAHSFIGGIPGGYQANVLELGASLSGGQRQRLAIARALLRNPSILILDEATSQIDAESEAQINEAIAEISRQRTVILIAHRLATVIGADRIVVMDEGRIVDQGRHDELLKRCELYRRLNRTQLLATA